MFPAAEHSYTMKDSILEVAIRQDDERIQE